MADCSYHCQASISIYISILLQLGAFIYLMVLIVRSIVKHKVFGFTLGLLIAMEVTVILCIVADFFLGEIMELVTTGGEPRSEETTL
jgi:hypothetical protein